MLAHTEVVTQSSPLFDPHALQGDAHFWLDGELLFWKSNMGSLDYGTTSKSSSRIVQGHTEQPHFDWDWGARLGLGYKLPHDKWDLFLNYTYVQGRADGHAGGGSEVVFPLWASSFSIPVGTSLFADSAHARWNLHLNMGDLELGRTCFASQWLSLRPFMGVRGLVIDQDYRVTYKGGTVAPLDKDKVHMDSDFWGVGIRMGVNTLWGLGKGFSIYGNGSASLLSGHFDVHEKEKLQGSGVYRMHIKRDNNPVVVTADLGLGLQWDYLFSKNRYHVGVKLGYEFDMFFNQNQLFNFVGSSPGSLHTLSDDLSFMGVTLGLRFDF